MVSYPFPEIELEDECEPEFQYSDLSLIFKSISTPVVLPKLGNILEPVLIPIIPELKSIISPIHIPSVNENQDSISFHPFELAQISRIILTFWQVILFSEIELMQDCDLDPQIGHSISLFDSIITLVSLRDFFHIPESILNHVSVHCEIELPIFYDHISLIGKVCEYQFFGLDPIF